MSEQPVDATSGPASDASRAPAGVAAGEETLGRADRLRADLTAAMKGRDSLRAGTIRMALTAIRAEEVSGDVARRLTDAELISVLGREARKRREAATAYDEAGRPELGDRERAELAVLEEYLPQQLGDQELATVVATEVAAAGSAGVTGMAAMGRVMKAVQAKVAGRAEGARVASEVRRQLTAG